MSPKPSLYQACPSPAVLTLTLTLTSWQVLGLEKTFTGEFSYCVQGSGQGPGGPTRPRPPIYCS